MKTTTAVILAAGIALLASATASFAVIRGAQTKIAVVCPNVILWWPSAPGQSFLVEYRPDLNPGTPWTQITNYFLAAVGTNQTTFVHSNQVQCSSGQMSAMSSMNVASVTPQVFTAALVDAVLSGQAAYPLTMPPMPPVWTNGVWMAWEDVYGPLAPIMMPIPDALRQRVLAASTQGTLLVFDPTSGTTLGANASGILTPLDGPQPDGPQPDGPQPAPSMGFYRVINVTPVAGDDAFSVEQYSSGNQLDVLKNDSDPNDDRFLISAVSSAGHGDVQYTPDGSTFQYSPASDFWGIDSFTYTITNFHGSSASATVTVFVNQSGNQQPSAGDVYITLQTNVYTAAFNAITNAVDYDNDTLTLVSVGPARLGGVSTNASGDVNYTRDSNSFGRDAFTYSVTDGKGGYAVGNVFVSQIDSDGDGMPDEWKVRNGLDPMTDDSDADPDNDGLPNLAEYLLRTNPHLADNPLYLGVTNGAVLSGFAEIPLPSLNRGIDPQPIFLYVNGQLAANSFLSQGPDGEWFLNWNTVFMTNGTYTIKPAFQYKAESGSGLVFGPEQAVQVSNLITFDRITSVFSDFLVIEGTLPVPNASFLVQLYDENDNPLVYGNFSTTNGQIQIAWDLTDGHGNQIAFASVHARFDVTLSGGGNGPSPQDSSPTTVWEWFLKGRTPGPGNTFVSAWGWDSYTYSFNNNTEQMMLNSVLNILGNPGDPNAYYLAPNANVPYAMAFRFDSLSDKQTLLDALSQNQNFFWIGHGSYNGILGNKDRADIGPSDIDNILHNNAYQSRPNHPKEDKHQYRLVILNGCETYSSLWAGVFGIPFSSETTTNIVLDYQYTGQMPRAFVGFSDVIKIPFNWDPSGIGHAQYGVALGELTSKWMSGYPLDFCLDSFASTALSYGYTGNDSWRISGCTDLTRW